MFRAESPQLFKLAALTFSFRCLRVLLRCLRFRNMDTNAQTHADLIWSFQFDKGAATIIIAAVVVALVVLMAFARKRMKA